MQEKVEMKGIPELKNVEFQTVDYLLDSSYKSKTTDAFILAYVKFEKQMRRIVFFLLRKRGISQKLLREFLSENDKLNYQTFKNYFDRLHTRPFFDVLNEQIGNGKGKAMWKTIERYRTDRSKIFHGLLTESGLEEPDLRKRIDNLREWCESVGEAMEKEIGYDGLRRSPASSNEKGAQRFSGQTSEELRAWLGGLGEQQKHKKEGRNT